MRSAHCLMPHSSYAGAIVKKPKKAKPFETEAALCAAYLATVDAERWVSYPETAGWDILLVRRADGFQIGIQAKQRMNTDVINQAIEDFHSWGGDTPGPDCRAVLVPSCAGFGEICKYLGIVVIQPMDRNGAGRWHFSPGLPLAPPAPNYAEDWPEWAPSSRHVLPSYVPDVPAGASAPVQLTEWKIKAIKLAILLERHGSVIRADFSHLRLDHRRWIAGGWVRLEGGAFVPGELPDFKTMHPRVYGEIAADFEKWKPVERAIALPLQQGHLLDFEKVPLPPVSQKKELL